MYLYAVPSLSRFLYNNTYSLSDPFQPLQIYCSPSTDNPSSPRYAGEQAATATYETPQRGELNTPLARPSGQDGLKAMT